MLHLNIHNVEEYVFFDKRVWKLLPEFQDLFGQWTLAQRTPALKQMGKRAIADFFNRLDERHKIVLQKYFGTDVTFDKLDYRIVHNYCFDLEEAEKRLGEVDDFPYFSISRNDNQLYISFWK